MIMTSQPPASSAGTRQAVEDCVLCETPGGELLWTGELARVVLVDEAAYPGFTRVICQRHVKEMTDLSAPDRAELMNLVWLVESVQRAILSPDKVNVAALGNMVPHLHWHVIPRWRDDACFPEAIWAPARRTDGIGEGAARAGASLATYAGALRTKLSQLA
jgi:diadenosine tetraphosphate (Ap4A) HIT family hydrolase